MGSSAAINAYLIAYNAACCAGWALVLSQSLQTLASNSSDGIMATTAWTTLYPAVSTPLMLSQCAAFLEIVHVLFKVVRSPLHVTFLQVSSRLVALFALVYSESAQGTRLLVLVVDVYIVVLTTITSV